MKWILAACGALFALTLYLVARVAIMDHCALWHAGEPWTFLVVATLASNAVIAACYFLIPMHSGFLAWRLWRARLPRWMTLLALLLGCFVLSCGFNHVDSVLARPVVYCWESLTGRIITAGFSGAFLVACIVCAEPLLLMLDLVAKSKLLAPILSLSSPFETTAVLRGLSKEP